MCGRERGLFDACRRVARTTLAAGLLTYSAFPAMSLAASKPEFGPNVLIFNPSMPSSAIQRRIDEVYTTQQHNEFGEQRTALMFLPGDYKVDIPVGFYTEVIGLGASPDGVHIMGNVHSDASLPNNNATTTFWRAVEGFSLSPAGGSHAMGRVAGSTVPAHAHSRRYRAPSARRLGQRRLDVRRAH